MEVLRGGGARDLERETAKPAPTTWLAARLSSPPAPGGCIVSPT